MERDKDNQLQISSMVDRRANTYEEKTQRHKNIKEPQIITTLGRDAKTNTTTESYNTKLKLRGKNSNLGKNSTTSPQLRTYGSPFTNLLRTKQRVANP